MSKEIKAGLIAIFAIAGFVAMFQFMKGRNIFSTDNVYYARFDNVQGVDPSTAISINGLKVGHVDKIIPVMNPKGGLSFVIRALIKDDYPITKNSVLEIFETGLMSGKQMRVNLAYGGAVAKDGDTLKGDFQPSMMNSLSSQVGPVKDQLQSVLKRVDSLTNNANKILDDQNRAEIKALLASLNHTVASFENTSRQTNALLASSDPKLQKVLDNANLATISARTAIDKYGHIAEQVDVSKLNNTIDKLSVTAQQLNNVIAGIQKGEGSLGKLVKDEQLYDNLTKTSQNLNSLVEDMKANPKRYVNFSVFGKNSK